MNDVGMEMYVFDEQLDVELENEVENEEVFVVGEKNLEELDIVLS